MKNVPQPKTWKELERHPLSAEYEDLEGFVWNQFLANLKEFGILNRRIVLAKDGDCRWLKILDGWQLQRACVQLDITPTYIGLADDMDPAKYVEIKNDCRRSETIGKVRERVTARRKRIEDLRRNGKTIREIADQEKVGTTTVLRDLSNLVPPGTTIPDDVAPDSEFGVNFSPPNFDASESSPNSVGMVNNENPDADSPPPESTQVPGRNGKPLCAGCAAIGKASCMACTGVKPGKAPGPTEKQFTDAYGPLVRLVDAQAAAQGYGALDLGRDDETKEAAMEMERERFRVVVQAAIEQRTRHGRLMELASIFLEEFKLWRKLG